MRHLWLVGFIAGCANIPFIITDGKAISVISLVFCWTMAFVTYQTGRSY